MKTKNTLPSFFTKLVTVLLSVLLTSAIISCNHSNQNIDSASSIQYEDAENEQVGDDEADPYDNGVEFIKSFYRWYSGCGTGNETDYISKKLNDAISGLENIEDTHEGWLLIGADPFIDSQDGGRSDIFCTGNFNVDRIGKTQNFIVSFICFSDTILKHIHLTIENGKLMIDNVNKMLEYYVEMKALADEEDSKSSSNHSNESFPATNDPSYMPSNPYYNAPAGGNFDYQWQEIGTTTNPVQPHQVTKSCRLCYGSGNCSNCNGNGWHYGFGGSKVACSNCNQSGRCPSCGGSGTKTTTEYY